MKEIYKGNSLERRFIGTEALELNLQIFMVII